MSAPTFRFKRRTGHAPRRLARPAARLAPMSDIVADPDRIAWAAAARAAASEDWAAIDHLAMVWSLWRDFS